MPPRRPQVSQRLGRQLSLAQTRQQAAAREEKKCSDAVEAATIELGRVGLAVRRQTGRSDVGAAVKEQLELEQAGPPRLTAPA